MNESQELEPRYLVEVFLPIEGYEDYWIGSYGNCFNAKSNKFLKPIRNKSGHLKFILSKDGKQQQFYAHRLVALAFVNNPDPQKFKIINHKTEDPSDNAWTALEWCDYKYNSNYGTAHERQSQAHSKPVNQYDADHNLVGSYKSLTEASKQTGFSTMPIFQGVHDGKLHKGFFWQYV